MTLSKRLCHHAMRACALLPLLALAPAHAEESQSLNAALSKLEQQLGGRIGVVAIDTGSGKRIGFRSDERFPMCSSFKMVLAGAILKKSVDTPALMQKQIAIAAADMVFHAPITGKHQGGSLTIEALSDAVVRYSDNPAANLLLKEVGGPAGLTAFARSIGDTEYRSDRFETELNTAIPGDPRDTTTPAAMAGTVQALVLGKALPPAQQKQLKDWMLGNTTGNAKIRAGVPAGWAVADKTGNCGRYGTTNDIGLMYPPGRAPIALAIYTARIKQEDEGSDATIAAVAKLVAEKL
jgi:beta-lactamase class A